MAELTFASPTFTFGSPAQPSNVSPGESYVGTHATLVPQSLSLSQSLPTEGPSWGHAVLVLGAVSSFLEPFCGGLLSNIDKPVANRLLKYPHEGPCVGRDRAICHPKVDGAVLRVQHVNFDRLRVGWP